MLARGRTEHRRVEQSEHFGQRSHRSDQRLFEQHLGASPIAVAQTRRVLFAKGLIHDTRLPMAEIALAPNDLVGRERLHSFATIDQQLNTACQCRYRLKRNFRDGLSAADLALGDATGCIGLQRPRPRLQ